MKPFMPFVIILAGCVSNAQYSSLAKAYDAVIRETKGDYLAVPGPKAVHDARQHFIDDAERARDSAFELAGISPVAS